MTSKEKAIVISHKTAREIIEYENANQGVFTEKQMKELRDYFTAQENQPTLDDAIKVVEEMKNNPNNNFMTMKQVLTALKGLKEGKE